MGSDHQHVHPVQNSEVYVLDRLGSASLFAHPPPPSPPTPCEIRSLTPVIDSPCLTPLSENASPSVFTRLASAIHVLSTEATALSHLTRLYEFDPVARNGFDCAVEAIITCMAKRGKVVICGVGKSGHIAKKLVATMNSLRISATYLHPTEALHGDLGKVGDNDVILLITFSGKTPELLSLIPHFSNSLPTIIMTSHIRKETCAIIDARPDCILLPAPIHETEVISFGVSAPTSSTTVALALGDALAVTISGEIHPNVAAVFSRYHPGGAIGQNSQKLSQKLFDIAVALRDLPDVALFDQDPKAVHAIMAGYRSPSGWARHGQNGVISPRRIKRLCPEHMDLFIDEIPNLAVSKTSFISIHHDLNLPEARKWIQDARESGVPGFDDDAILAITSNEHVISVVEIGTVMSSIS